MEKILRNPDDPDTGGIPNPPAPSPNPPIPAEPIAARIVIDGKTHLELKLEKVEKDLEEERETRKEREVRVSVLEDELSRLKRAEPPPGPRPKKKRAAMTFFEEEE